MKIHNTQRLFWKQWPYKAIIEIKPELYGHYGWRRVSDADRRLRHDEFNRLLRWCKSRFPDAGIRRETHLSIFLSNEEELNDLINNVDGRILEVWKPENDSAKDLLLEHGHDVIRDRPWYGKYPIRARIRYNDDFRRIHVPNFKQAVASLDGAWHAAGLLKEIIEKESLPRAYGWGQPLHLYLENAEDAALLRLTCGDCIERFERIRKP
jgi:hypothetical protein